MAALSRPVGSQRMEILGRTTTLQSPPYFYPPVSRRELLRCARRVVFSRHPINTLSTFGFIACCAHRSRTNEATREAPLFVSENCARSPSTFPATPISKRVSTRFQFARAHGIISFFTRQRAANY